MDLQSVICEKQRIGLGSKKMINRLINELMAYGMREYLVDEDDRVYSYKPIVGSFRSDRV